MLASANPDEVKGTDYSVRQLLDDFSAGLDDQLAGQPEVEAEVRTTIGRAYSRLGVTEQAESHLKKALELRRGVFGTDHEKVAEVLTDYALNLLLQRRWAEADAALGEALGVYRRRPVRGAPFVRAIRVSQHSLVHQKRYPEAQTVMEEALAFARSLPPGAEFPDIANMLHRQAGALVDQQQFEAAEAMARQSLAMHRRLHGDEHLETAWGLNTLRRALVAQKKFGEAEALQREALAIFRKRLGDEHTATTTALQQLKNVLHAQGKTEELKALVLEELGAAAGRMNQKEAEDWFKRGRARADLKQWEAALEAHAEGIALAGPAAAGFKGGKHLCEIGIAASQGGDRTSAEKAYRASIAVLQALADADPADLASRHELGRSHNWLGRLFTETRRRDEAEREHRRAVEIYSGLVALADPVSGRFHRQELAWTRRHLGDVLRRANRVAEAEAELRSVVELCDALAAEHPRDPMYPQWAGEALWSLGDTRLQSNRFDEAEQDYRGALNRYAALAADYPDKRFYRQEQGFSLRKLAHLMERAGRPADAERHFRDALGWYMKLVAEVPGSAFYRQEAAQVNWLLAGLLQRGGRWADTEAALREAVCLNPDHGDAKNALGDVEAEAKARHAVRSQPRSANAHAALGEVLRRRGNLAESEAALREAMRLSPDDPHLKCLVGPTYAQLGRWGEAAAAFRRGAQLHPEDHMRWYLGAVVHLEAGNVEGYRENCREMLARFGDTTDPYVAERTAKTCALAPGGVPDPEVVVKLADRAVTGTEANVHYRFFVLSKGLAEYRAGRHAEAVRWMGRYAPEAGGLSWDGLAFSVLAMANHRLGHAEAARTALDAARAILKQQMPDPANGRPFDEGWHEWLRFGVLCREAEALLTPSESTAGAADGR